MSPSRLIAGSAAHQPDPLHLTCPSETAWDMDGACRVTVLGRMRHDSCGGQPAKADLLRGIEGVSSQPVRRIVLRGG